MCRETARTPGETPFDSCPTTTATEDGGGTVRSGTDDWIAVDTSSSPKRPQNRARSSGQRAARTAGTFSAFPVDTRRLLR